MKLVFFFKTENLPQDHYRMEFEKAGFLVDFVPLLSFQPCDVPSLRCLLQQHVQFGGLIITSETVLTILESYISEMDSLLEPWRRKKVFALGGATIVHLTEKLRFEPSLVFGKSTCSASDLAKVIVNDNENCRFSLPLLFLCGDRRRNELPEALKRSCIDFHEFVAYYTVLSTESIIESLFSRLKTMKNELPSNVDPPDSEPHEIWLTFFSPSGIEAFLDIISTHMKDSKMFNALEKRDVIFERTENGTTAQSHHSFTKETIAFCIWNAIQSKEVSFLSEYHKEAIRKKISNELNDCPSLDKEEVLSTNVSDLSIGDNRDWSIYEKLDIHFACIGGTTWQSLLQSCEGNVQAAVASKPNAFHLLEAILGQNSSDIHKS